MADALVERDTSTPPPPLGVSLARLASLPGVDVVALLDREGFLIEAAGAPSADPDALAGVASRLADGAAAIAVDLDGTAVTSALVEWRTGALLMHDVHGVAILAVSLADPAVIAPVRDEVQMALRDLVRGI